MKTTQIFETFPQDASIMQQLKTDKREAKNRSPSLQGFMRRFLCALLLVLPPLNLPAEEIKKAPALSLANVYHDGVDAAQYWVSEKLDGVRAYWDGAALYSRQGNRFQVPDWFVKEFPQTPLDGELWMDRGAFETLSGIVRRKKPNDEDWLNIRFMVFDLPADSADFDGRLRRLKKILGAVKSPQIGLVEQFRVADSAELKAALRRVVSQGGEGLMLRKTDSRYRAGRSDDLLKLKLHEDAEAVVIAHLPGKGKYKGMLGSLLVETPDGKRFKLGSGFSDQERRQPPPIGAIITYKHYGKTRNGIPRFASFLRIRNTP